MEDGRPVRAAFPGAGSARTKASLVTLDTVL